jgi:hypothetical protein
MTYSDETIKALAVLRSITSEDRERPEVIAAFNTLDNSGVFAALDEQTDYASATEILAESAAKAVAAVDPAEWGDTTAADMARHQLAYYQGEYRDEVRQMSEGASCTCGRRGEPSPTLHAGTCPVWAQHHNLNR